MSEKSEANETTEQPAIKIQLSPESTERTFTSIDALAKFLDSQRAEWQSVGSLREFFRSLTEDIRRDRAFSQPLDIQTAQRIASIVEHRCREKRLIYSETLQGKTILELARSSEDTGEAAYTQMARHNHNPGALGNPQYVKGVIAAEMLYGPGRGAEAAAEHSAVDNLQGELKELRDSYSAALKDKSENLDALAGKFEESRNETTQKSIDGFNARLTDLTKEFLQFKEACIEDFSKRTESLNALERTYREKLKLEGPASYWKDLESEWEDKGRKWRNSAILASLIFVSAVMLFLYLPPDILKAEGKFSVSEVKGLIMFALAVSVSVFAIRFFFKMSISAYHLSRDAKERAQLAFFYLALTKEAKVTLRERQIILQSLFSRADTGLLKAEGLSMPTGTVDAIIGGISGKHH